MKKTFQILIVTIVLVFSGCVENTPDSENSKIEVNKSTDVPQITQSDIIEALEFGGIGIHKINIGGFDTTYGIKFIIEEFKDQKLFRTDTLDYDIINIDYADADTNQVTKKVNYTLVYLKAIRIFSRNLEDRFHFEITVPRIKLSHDLEFISLNQKNFYKTVEYEKTHWSLNEKVPLLFCGSSWIDENGQNRFCTANKMGENSRTNELLSFSPHYIIISYITAEIKK
jgi:hypothetical protein